MDSIKLTTQHPMRDPMGDEQRYSDYCAREVNLLADADLSCYHPSGIASAILNRVIGLYGRGNILNDLIKCLAVDLISLDRETHRFLASESTVATSKVDPKRFGFLAGAERSDFAYLAIALLLLPTTEQTASLGRLISTLPEQRTYAFELLLKAFVPDWKMAKKYNRKGYRTVNMHLPWADPFVRALAVPAAQREQTLAGYMAQWCRLMKPWGYKPVRDFSPEAAERRGELESLFDHFAWEVALAVCAYDLDDNGFRDHPYYPRDVVDYYRANLRNNRDSWRAMGVGAGICIEPPPPPAKADLAKSKQKGYARWLELICDGDKDAHAAIVETTGKLRSLKKSAHEVFSAMGENGQSVRADIKDDDTLQAQLDHLLQARSLEGFAPPNVPPAGPARCEMLLQTATHWTAQNGYQLHRFDLDDDAWHAVLVRADYADEFVELTQQLGLGDCRES